jgi:3-hydroxyisobutyrate dehydrogenase-like beta-hydroxyacid dehydrogenase
MTKQSVGLIGVGLMGHGIGKNIVAKGYPLTVLAHRNRAPVEDLLAKDAKEVKSARELAQASDVIILCVTGSPQVEETIFGKDGVLEGLRSGTVVVDCSTAEPGSTMKVAAAIAGKGGRFVDAPLVRTPKEAEEGRLGVMTGGDPEVIKEIRPILECFAEAIVHAGGIGAGHTLKLINNFIALGTAAAVAEGIATAARAGVDMTALRDVVSSGGANSVMFERLIKVPLANDDTAAKFAISNAAKDLRYYTNMAENLPVAGFVAEAVHQTFIMALNRGYRDKFVPRLVDLICEVNNIKLRRP